MAAVTGNLARKLSNVGGKSRSSLKNIYGDGGETIITKLNKNRAKYEFKKKPLACAYAEGKSYPKCELRESETSVYFEFKNLRKDLPVVDENLISIVFKNDSLESNLLLLLKDCLQDGHPLLTVIKFEFCNLQAKHIEQIAELLTVFFINVKEVSVNGNPIPEQNFYLLLKQELTSLSLKYCSINIDGMKQISEELYKPYVNPLLHLNLATNALYDESLYYVARILRMNRKLKSLNLADNKITERGIRLLLEPLQKFELNEDELIERRKIRFEYHKKMIDVYCATKSDQSDLSITCSARKIRSRRRNKFFERRIHHKVGHRPSVPSYEQENNLTSRTSIPELPHHPALQDSVEESTSIFCYGNNILTNLNLSYNKIRQEALPLILQMISYQNDLYSGKPEPAHIGITRLSLQGNRLSETDIIEVETALSRKYQLTTGSIDTMTVLQRRR
ncbi:leucine-rich repeat-containing protein 71-like [Diabrotica virgifera virgifera]|uniref:Leucine-rich repeat-containing protein 71-like n=1 Tax=Diabrotica virgifera virgifera TaxID=50390 RepID=A0ABM5KJB9_DIAVI|nr:leucine-rich repeat-containing protein 71-like [Diabrotica virgifera virgifera]